MRKMKEERREKEIIAEEKKLKKEWTNINIGRKMSRKK